MTTRRYASGQYASKRAYKHAVGVLRVKLVVFMVVFILAPVMLIMGSGKYTEYVIGSMVHAQVNVPHPEVVEKVSVKEQVWKLLSAELTFDEAIDGMAIVNCESGFNQYAVNKNNDSSFDLGTWQINTGFHGKNISREDMFNVEKATKYAIKKFKESNHSWKLWVCSKKLNIK